MEEHLAEQKSQKSSLWNKKGFIPISIAVVICLVLSIWWGINHFLSYVYTDDAMLDSYRSNVSSQVLGELVELRVREGEWVKSGDLIALLDSSVQQAQLQVAEAEVAQARAKLQLTRGELEQQQSLIDQLEGQNGSEAAKSSYDQAIIVHRLAILDAARREASLRLARAQLEQTVIRSAIDGQVAMRWLYPGDVVTPGQPIVALYDMAKTWVTAYVDETRIAKIRVGHPARISVDSYPGVDFSGEVVQIGPATGQLFSVIPPQNASGNFTKVTQRIPVTLSISLASPRSGQKIILRPGTSAQVRIAVR